MSIETKSVELRVEDGTTMQAYSACPSGPGRWPGLIVFQEAFGVNSHIRHVVERFAAEGYVAIAPELFHRTAPAGFTCAYDNFPSVIAHMNAVNGAALVQDVIATWNWLQKEPRVRHDAIACIGYCMGGRTAFVANTVKPIKAAISYYGGRTADYLSLTPKLHAPMLFFWGGLDTHIPAEQIAAIVASLRQAKKPFTNVVVSDADHGFFCDERGSYNKQAASEAWALTLAFLKNKVG